MKLLSGIAPKKPKGAPRKAPSRFLLRVGFILLMLGLCAFAIYQLVSHMTVGLDTLRTQEITESSYIDLELLVFRDEEILPAEGDLFRYHVSDGARVGKDALIATAYRAEKAEDLQELLNLYVRRLALSEARGDISLDRADEIKRELEQAYQMMLSSADEGRMGMASDAAERLKNALGQYAALVGIHTPEEDRPAALKAAISELLAGCLPLGDIQAEKSGYFYYETDGYEQLFDPDRLATVTPEELELLKNAEAVSYGDGIMGKMVYGSTWYAATYLELSEEEQSLFEVGGSYVMICDDSAGTEIPMTVVRMESTEDGTLLVFEANTMPEGFSFSRLLRVETVTEQIHGYRIPREALVTLTSESGDRVTGVYILVGNVVEFRKLYIVVKRESYVIAATYEKVKAMQEALTQEAVTEESITEEAATQELPTQETATQEAVTQEPPDVLSVDEWSYLRLNDKIITRGTGLYEGKMIS